MARSEFSPSVRVMAFNRCGGNCERCGVRLSVGRFAYDHIKADGLGGAPTLDNCQVLCIACHSIKTHTEDRPIMAKADRQRKAHIGAKAETSRPIPGSKASPWKNTFSHGWVRR